MQSYQEVEYRPHHITEDSQESDKVFVSTIAYTAVCRYMDRGNTFIRQLK